MQSTASAALILDILPKREKELAKELQIQWGEGGSERKNKLYYKVKLEITKTTEKIIHTTELRLKNKISKR